MHKFASALLLILISLAGNAQGKFNPADITLSWEVGQNQYNGSNQFISTLTFLNKKTAMPASGWSLYFNLPRTIDPASVTSPFHIDHINGDLFRLYPAGSQTFPKGQPIAVQFVASDWAVNYTDAPSGPYLLFDKEPAKGYSIKDYKVIPSTQPKQYLRFAGDKIGLITPADIYKRHAVITDTSDDQVPVIFPTPVMVKRNAGNAILASNSDIDADPAFSSESAFLKEVLDKLTVPSTGKASIRLVKSPMPEEAYTLTVSNAEVVISAGSGAGIFYGIQSLQSMFPPTSWGAAKKPISIPSVMVEDRPRFGYRSFMLDIARNFQSKQQLLKTIELLALYKINTLHLHFNDDEGWRIQMPSFPELTDVGARRGAGYETGDHLPPSYGSGPDTSGKRGSGYYTTNDFIDILKFAQARHIQVIPEIETPGHARAAIVAMKHRYREMMKAGRKDEAEKYLLSDAGDTSVYKTAQGWTDNVMNVAMPSVYVFLDRVLEDLKDIYSRAGLPLSFVHVGGDEVPAGVWEGSPLCQQLMKAEKMNSVDDLWYYYFGKVNDILVKKGLKMHGWEEIAMRKTMLDGARYNFPNPDFVNDRFRVDVWNNVLGWGAEDLAYKLANAGYPVVLSMVSNFYFDMAYQKTFEEPGYYWGGYLDVDKPFYFIPYDYFRNAKEDLLGNPLDRSIFIGKERLNDYGKTNIVGVQGLLWSENIINTDRMEYMLLPKLLGMAERAWAQSPVWAETKDSAVAAREYSASWSTFVNTLGKRELPRLDHFAGGFNYRIPEPGVIVENGMVKANSEFPGMQIRYTLDGSEPTIKSALYTGPVKDNGKVKMRLFSASGRAGRVSVAR